jgi:hypothetical protein
MLIQSLHHSWNTAGANTTASTKTGQPYPPFTSMRAHQPRFGSSPPNPTTGPIPDTIPEGSNLRSLRMHNACPAGLGASDGMLVSMGYVPCGEGITGPLPASLANAKKLQVRLCSVDAGVMVQPTMCAACICVQCPQQSIVRHT